MTLGEGGGGGGGGVKAVHNSLLQQTLLCCSNLECNQTCFITNGLEEPKIGRGGADGRQ